MQMNHYTADTVSNILMSLSAGQVKQQDLSSPEVFEAVEAIIKAGEAANKLIYGENK